ncbi:putative ribonuclease H-like domain-containing protein [Tanacetum coccineum]
MEVLVTKPHNKTPYELLLGRPPSIGFMRPFGCLVTILNTLDPLGKFDGKADEGVLVGYSELDQTSIKENSDAGTTGKEKESAQQYVLLPVWSSKSPSLKNTGDGADDAVKGNKDDDNVPDSGNGGPNDDQRKRDDKGKGPKAKSKGKNLEPKFTNNTNNVHADDQILVNTIQSSFWEPEVGSPFDVPHDLNIPHLEEIVYLEDEEDVGAEAGISNLESNIPISLIPTLRVHKDHPKEQIIVEPKRVHQALKDPSWIEAMQEELLQFKLQKVWVLVDLPKGKRAIGTKWIFRNKTDERGIIEAIRLFLAYASFMRFIVYQIDVKSNFLYGTIEEEVYVCQPPGFEDPSNPDKVYKVVKALYGLHQAPRAWYETLANYLLENGFQRGKIDQTLFIKKQKGDILLVQIYVDDIIFGSTNKMLCIGVETLMKDMFQMSSMGELTFFLGLQVKQKKDGIFISQDKYVAEILKKFGFTNVKSASTSIETDKPLLKDPDGDEVDLHLFRSMIGSLIYLTASRPDIMFVVCACARYQVTPKVSHLLAVKRIFRYLKGKPHLGLWYPRDSPFDLVAYSDSDYAGASLDKKSTAGGCQFLGCRLISWQCKKQTVVATSSTEVEYVAAASCCAQVLWLQN